MASSVRQGHETGVDGPFSRHIGYMCLENGTRNRCVSIIAIFILSFPRHEILDARVRYDTIRYATLERGIVHVVFVAQRLSGLPLIELQTMVIKKARTDVFFKGTGRNQKLITRLTLGSLYHRRAATRSYLSTSCYKYPRDIFIHL